LGLPDIIATFIAFILALWIDACIGARLAFRNYMAIGVDLADAITRV